MAEFLQQALIALGLLDRREIGALQVLDQGDFERVAVAEVAEDGGDFMQLRLLRRAPTPQVGRFLGEGVSTPFAVT